MCSEKRKWIEGNLYSAINHWGLETCISRYLHIVAVVLFEATMRPMPLVGSAGMRNQPGCTWTRCGEGQAQLVRKGTTCFERSMALNGSNCYGIIVHCLQEYESRSEVKKDEISVIQGWFVWWFSFSLSKFVCLFAICFPTYIFQIKFCALFSQNS